MHRKRARKVVLVLVGLLFIAGVIPLTMFFSREPAWSFIKISRRPFSDSRTRFWDRFRVFIGG